jgi:hypothetical protein
MANGIDEAAFRNLANVLNMTSREMSQFADKLNDGTASLASIKSSVDSAKKGLDALESEAGTAAGEVRGFRSDIDQTRDALGKFRSFTGTLATGVGKTLLGAIVGIAGATVKAAFDLNQLGFDVEQSGLGPMLRRYGGDTQEALRGLEYGADLAGINMLSFAKIMMDNSQAIGSAGVEQFGASVKSVRLMFDSLKKSGKEYGYTQEAITEYMGMYENVILSQARTIGMTGERRSRENQRFLLETAELASTFKKSREQIAKESAEMLQEPNSAFLAMQLSFEAEGTAAAENLNSNLALLKQALDPQTFNTALEALSTSISVGTEFASKDLRELYGMAPDMADAVVEIVNSMKSGQQLDKNYLSDILGNAFDADGFSLAASIAGAAGGFNAATQSMAETIKRLEIMNSSFTEGDASNIAATTNSIVSLATGVKNTLTDIAAAQEKGGLGILTDPNTKDLIKKLLDAFGALNKEVSSFTENVFAKVLLPSVDFLASGLQYLVQGLFMATDAITNFYYAVTGQDKVSIASDIYSVLRKDENLDPAGRGQVLTDMLMEMNSDVKTPAFQKYWDQIERPELGETAGGSMGSQVKSWHDMANKVDDIGSSVKSGYNVGLSTVPGINAMALAFFKNKTKELSTQISEASARKEVEKENKRANASGLGFGDSEERYYPPEMLKLMEAMAKNMSTGDMKEMSTTLKEIENHMSVVSRAAKNAEM